MNAMAEVRFISPTKYRQLTTRFDFEQGVLWGFMHPAPRPTFNLDLLSDLRGFVESIAETGGTVWNKGKEHAVNYAVIASSVPGVFNLGGDLALFRDAIIRRDRELLVQYGESCIGNLYPWSRDLDLPLTTISLVQGDALGGGFECALSSTVLIAEESANMGFPEVLFNLFPGMGAYSFLSRKVGRRTAQEIITSGIKYTGRQLYNMGIVDVLAPDGGGEIALYSYIKNHAKTANGRRGMEQVRREIEPVTYEELLRVVHIWADTALRLEDRDLKMMDRLVRAQNKANDIEPATVTPLQRVPDRARTDATACSMLATVPA